MEVSECLLDQEILENSTANEIISDAGEQKCNSESYEESNDEMNKPQESGIITQVIMGEAPERTISDKELEEQSQNPNCLPGVSGSKRGNTASFRKLSKDNSQQLLSLGFQRSRRSIGQYSLQSPKAPQEQSGVSEADTKDSRSLISRRTGKELQDKFNKTNFMWESLSEILHPSREIPQVCKDAATDVVGTKDLTPVGDAENEWPSVQEFLQISQHLEGQEGQESQSGGPPPAGKESNHSSQLVTLKELEHSIPSPVEDESWQDGPQPEKQLAGDDSQQPTEHQSLESNKPSQQTGEANAEEGGKEVKSSFNQTGFTWERKHLSSTEKKVPGPEDQESLAKEPSP